MNSSDDDISLIKAETLLHINLICLTLFKQIMIVSKQIIRLKEISFSVTEYGI